MITEVVVMLPALSTAVPVKFWFAPTVVTVMGEEQDAIPDKLSAQTKLMVALP